MITLTIEQLENLVDNLKNQVKHDNMLSYVNISMHKHPNGREYIEFEQPCAYRECYSNYNRFDERN